MAHWLVKSEPSSWSWDDQVAAGKAGTPWTGVRNHLAKKHLMAMRAGDRAFFYHSNEGKAVVGIVEAIGTHYPDPTDESGRFVVVDLRAAAPMKTPVTLAAIKEEPRLAKMELVVNSRLSVQPVRDEEWTLVCAMGGVKP